MKTEMSEKQMHHEMSRRTFLTAIGAGAAACMMPWDLMAMGIAKTKNGRKPNMILIFSDDQGYAEMTCQGIKDIPTPHLDSMAASGVRFTSGYVTAAVCAASRAGLLTGRYPQRFGFEHNPGTERFAADNFGVPTSEKTIAERLKVLGYATGMFGKWHVGYKKELTPPQRGFDEFFGFLEGAQDYLPKIRPSNGQKIVRGDQPVEEKHYLTDAFAREAVAFIEKHKDHPFFCYLAFNAVHAPLDASPELLDKFADIKDEKRRIYATMQASMDNAVGTVLQTLRQHKLEEDTIIFFISDNGGPTWQTTSRNDPLRGFKGQYYEGGIRIPFMLQWKGHVPAGAVYEKPVSSLDVMPTFLAAAGAGMPKDAGLDGVDLIPYLNGKKTGNPHDILFWRAGRLKAVRQGDWKLVTMDGRTFELYNLEADIGEKNNLINVNTDVAAKLKDALKTWESQMKDPLWVRNQKQDKRNRSNEIMRMFDKNNDGNLSRDEFPPMLKERFDQFDGNWDGVVSGREFGRIYQQEGD